MSQVFISYRRDDSADITGRIFDRLRAHFDKQILFRDVDVIPFGSDFRQVIRKAVEDCQVLLAVIGPTWLSIATEDGTRRLDDPHDFVRLEIETALKRNIPVIPVLVNKAAMPKAVHLPDSLQDLVYRNGLEVGRDPRFHPRCGYADPRALQAPQSDSTALATSSYPRGGGTLWPQSWRPHRTGPTWRGENGVCLVPPGYVYDGEHQWT